MTITHCPACGCEIFNGRTKSHETREQCFFALDMETESTNKRRQRLIKLELQDRRKAEAELQKVYEVNG